MRTFFRFCIIAFVFLSQGINDIKSAEIGTLSPNQYIAIRFKLDDSGVPYYNISYWNTTFLSWSALGLNFKDGGLLSKDLKVVSVSRKQIDETYPVISGKSKYSRNYYNETIIVLEEKSGQKRKMELYFRAYDDGAAFRYGIPEQNSINDFTLSTEETEFNFAGEYTCWAIKIDRFRQNHEGEYIKYKLSEVYNKPGDLLSAFPYATLPLTIEITGGLYACLSEANITDYAGMYLTRGKESYSFKSKLSPYPDDNSVSVKGNTPIVSPWRLFIIGKTPGDLIESNLVMNLNEPSKVKDASVWVKPGKSIWSWWAEDRGFDESFGYSIISTNTVKYYVDFAAQNLMDYVTIDGGWYGWFDAMKEGETHDLTKSLPELDLPYITGYAASKGIGIFLWVVWRDLEKQMDEALDYYRSLGIKGVKVDFMDRDDQYMVDFYHRVAKKCAERKILVNFHGAYKPDGFSRTYPNIITVEAVLANEYARWSNSLPNPEHNVTIPFTRMVVGPMDYTPGSMTNSTGESFISRLKYPMTKGTRAAQMAMMVVYESGLLTLCESPKIYENVPEFEFIKQVPASWDSTIVLVGQIGEYIIIARKKDNKWFIGGMTDWQERDLKIDFSFLEAGEYYAEIYLDAADANTNPQNVQILKSAVTKGDIKTFRMVKGGGLAIVVTKKL